jgi:hypothetical protein
MQTCDPMGNSPDLHLWIAVLERAIRDMDGLI